MLSRRPFEPLRLHLTTGATVEIKHPEAAIVTRSLVAVASGGPGVHDYVVHYNLIHVVKIEPINGTVGAPP